MFGRIKEGADEKERVTPYSHDTLSHDSTMVEAIGVYVDDFLFAESDYPEWNRCSKQ